MCNLNLGFLGAFFRHNGCPILNFIDLLISQLLIIFKLGWIRHPQSKTLLEARLQRRLVDLLVLGWVLAALWVDIVSKHVLSVIDTTLRWFSVSTAISMECWLTVVSRERGVSNPPRRVVKFAFAFF